MKIPTQYHRALAAWCPLALLTIIAIAPVPAPAQQLSQLFGNAAGAISKVASVQVAQDYFVTAVINSTGNLEVIAWYANLNSKQLVRQGTWYAGPASAVAISSPFALGAGVSGVFTTATIDANSYLDIIYWQLQPNGAISKVAETEQDGGALAVSIASVYYRQNRDPQFMTAIRNYTGNLQVSLWYLDPTYGIELSGTAYAGAVSAVSIACLQDLHSDVVTAVENSLGNLEVIQWFYNGSAVTRGSTAYTTTPAQSVAVVPGVETLNNPPFFVNAFCTAVPNPWTTVSPWNQDFGSQGGGVTAGIASQLAMIGHNGAAITVSTPYSSGGTYSLWVFDQNNSNQFSQVTGALGAYATAVSITLVDTSSSSVTTFAVAYRNSAGNLQIQLWNFLWG